MDRRTLCDHLGACGRRSKKIGLAFDRRRARTVWKIDQRGDGSESIGEGHGRATVEDWRPGAQIVTHLHFRGDFVWQRADDLDTEQLRKRQGIGGELVESIHGNQYRRTSASVPCVQGN